MTKLLAFDPGKGKTVLCGDVIGDVFCRIVSTKHFMQIVDGYGIQESAFMQMIAKGVKKIDMFVKETKDHWLSGTQEWIDHGKVSDYGFGKQRFLSLKYMKKKTL